MSELANHPTALQDGGDADLPDGELSRRSRIVRLRNWVTARRMKRFGVLLLALSVSSAAVLYWMLFVSLSNSGLTFENPLRIPKQLVGTEVDGRMQYRLVVDEGVSEFLPDTRTPTAGVNGSYLGPTLRLRRGDQVDLVVENRLDEMTTMHWHGMHVPARMDGTPHQQIEPEHRWAASFEVDQPAGTMWYHPHPHGNTGRQAYRGIAGMLWIDDDDSDSLDLPRTYGVDDFPIIIQDRLFDRDGSFQFALSRGAVYGDTVLINGTWNPKLSVESRRIRFRLLNGSNARIYYVGFDDNRRFHQIATDGGLLDEPIEVDRVVLAPGERAEIVVDFSDGETVTLKSFPEAGWLQTAESFFDGAGTGHLELLKIEPVPATRSSHRLPEKLVSIDRLEARDAARTRPMVLGGPVVQRPPGRQRGFGGRGIPINGKVMDMHRIDERVRLGDTEIWEVVNRSGQPHPFHVHLVQFQILDRGGRPPLGADRGWKDTVLVHPGEQVRVIMSFRRYADPQVPYMYHCHIMEHEDAGMMGQFLVVKEPEKIDLVRGKTSVIVFVIGLACEHCYEQLTLFDKVLAEQGVNLLIVTPDVELDEGRASKLKAPIVSDPEKKWAGWLGMVHEGPVHATVLLDRGGEVVWQDSQQQPYTDVDALVARAASVAKD